jgi:hypothetical protein
MAKSKTVAQHLDGTVTPDATPTVNVSAYRATASDWERANATAGWHVRVNTPSGPVDGLIRSVGQDNRTFSLDTASGILTASKPDIAVVLVRPITDWEGGMLAKVAVNATLAAFYTLPTYDVLSICHVIREHWFRINGGAKTTRVLKAMEAVAKGQAIPDGKTGGKAAGVSYSPLGGLAPAVAPAPVADAS